MVSFLGIEKIKNIFNILFKLLKIENIIFK
jgi:hypothetical protein